MSEPAVDAYRVSVCGDQGEGSAAFCAVLPQSPIDCSAPHRLVPGHVRGSPTVAQSATRCARACLATRAPLTCAVSRRQGSVRRVPSAGQLASYRPPGRGRRSRSPSARALRSSRSRSPRLAGTACAGPSISSLSSLATLASPPLRRHLPSLPLPACPLCLAVAAHSTHSGQLEPRL